MQIDYRDEGEFGWSASSPDLPGFIAVDKTLDGLKDLVADGIPFYLEDSAEGEH